MINTILISNVAVSIAVIGGGAQDFGNGSGGGNVALFLMIVGFICLVCSGLGLLMLITDLLFNNPTNHTKPNHIIEVIEPGTHGPN